MIAHYVHPSRSCALHYAPKGRLSLPFFNIDISLFIKQSYSKAIADQISSSLKRQAQVFVDFGQKSHHFLLRLPCSSLLRHQAHVARCVVCNHSRGFSLCNYYAWPPRVDPNTPRNSDCPFLITLDIQNCQGPVCL